MTFRVIVASLYILKWKCRYNCSSKYKVSRQNLLNEVEKMKTERDNGESTDDAEIHVKLDKIYEANKDAIGSQIDESAIRSSMTGLKKHDATIDYISRREAEADASDEDYDFREFENADVEEAEDRIYS